MNGWQVATIVLASVDALILVVLLPVFLDLFWMWKKGPW